MMPRGAWTLTGCLLISLVLGTVHAFSVLLTPIEAELGASRSAASLTYSLALIALTVAVTFGHRIYGSMPGWGIALIAGAGSAGGLLIAAAGGSLALLWLGYGVVFGAANGLGYGYALQLSAQDSPGREGLAMGLVTAAYAVGATLAPPLLEQAASDSLGLALIGLGGAIVFACLLAALCLAASRARFQPAPPAAQSTFPWREALGLWWIYGAAVLAGLMAIGHASEIAAELGIGLGAGLTVLAPSVIAICNMVGSVAGGVLIDRLPVRLIAVCLPLASAGALLWLVAGQGGVAVLMALGLIGAAYGATIAAYPALIAQRFGVAAGARVYGIVFTAWGTTGLVGPLGAAAIHDATQAYGTALLVAAAFGLASALGAGLWITARE